MPGLKDSVTRFLTLFGSENFTLAPNEEATTVKLNEKNEKTDDTVTIVFYIYFNAIKNWVSVLARS